LVRRLKRVDLPTLGRPTKASTGFKRIFRLGFYSARKA